MGKGGSKQTIGYRYLVGEHQVLCHGPIDSISQLKVDQRIAWEGNATGGAITINAPNLFGGDEKEGGVSGTVDIEMGALTQLQNSYLVSQLGSEVPAFRGVVAAVLRQCYLGTSPYLKPWAWRGTRVYVRQEGIGQWYPAKASIPTGTTISSGGSSDIEYVGGQVYSGASSGAGSGVQAFALTGGLAATPANGDLVIITSVTAWQDIGQPEDFHPGVPGYDELATCYADDASGFLAVNVTMFAKFMTATPDTTWEGLGTGDSVEDTSWMVTVFRGVHASILDVPPVTKLDYTSNQNIPATITLSDLQIVVPGTLATFLVSAGQCNITIALKPAVSGAPMIMACGGVEGDGSPSEWGVGNLEQFLATSAVDAVLASGGVAWGPAVVFDVGGDMNPAHIIRECLTDPDWGMGYLEADIDDASFTIAADTLYAEGLGMSLLWDKQIIIDDFIQQIIRHIDAALFVSRSTGKFVLKLIRADYDVEDLIELNESNIAKVDNPTWPAFGELINSVTVQYWDGAIGKDASRTVQDPALVQMQGQVLSTTTQYPGFTNERNALIGAQRDLRSLSSRILSCTIYCDETAKDLNIGDCFKFSWEAWQIETLVMRVIGLAFGDGRNNQVRITCTEDIFSTPDVVVIGEESGGWVDPAQPPVAVPDQIAFEAPYYELVQVLGQTNIDTSLTTNPEIGLVGAAASRPANGINARIWTDSGTGYEDSGLLDFCPYAELDTDIVQTDTVLAITNSENEGDVVLGTYCLLGEDENQEICRVDAISDSSLTLGRGCLDTTPKKHLAGTKIFFCDQFYGFDPTEFVLGESIDVKITPNSGSGILALADATAMNVTLDQRAFRPYAPGNLLIEGESYADAVYEDELDISWTDRDRTQQTGATIYDHTFGDIGPEPGVTYRVRGYLDGVLEHTEDPAVSPTTWTPSSSGVVKIEVDSLRDSVYSWQAAVHEFLYVTTAARITEDAEVRYTEEGDFRVTED